MALKEVSVALSPETSVAGRNKFLDGLVRRVTQARYYTLEWLTDAETGAVAPLSRKFEVRFPLLTDAETNTRKWSNGSSVHFQLRSTDVERRRKAAARGESERGSGQHRATQRPGAG